ncbi:MAG: hypothetical protein ABR958_03890 [Dehalococcoidales bacterium]
MNTQEHHHEEVVRKIAAQLKPVLDKSGQGVYIYLDDAHKVCNKKFADLLGYKSAREWAGTEAPLSDVVEEDQPSVISAYENASENMVASCLDVRVKNIKTGKAIKTSMIVVPLTDGGNHVFTVHFFSRK